MGYTEALENRDFRRRRPAPVQVSYLGFPATMGADFIDYVIADPVVLPFEDQPYFTEKIVHLPGCYQVNDDGRGPSARAPSRRSAGLPLATAFVFCCRASSSLAGRSRPQCLTCGCGCWRERPTAKRALAARRQ